MSLDYLRIFQADHPKIRIGSSQDGGYVMMDNIEYDCFLSCGIGNDIGFEKEFCSRYPLIPCFAYDGTIDRLPEENGQIQFIKKNITSYESETTTNLLDKFETYHDIFLKMDIETFEFRWLQKLSMEQIWKIKQLVIEFHFPFTEPGFTHLDAPLPVNEKLGVLQRLAENTYFGASSCEQLLWYDNI